MHRQRADHLCRGLHHQPCFRSSYLTTTDAISVAAEDFVETQATYHGGFCWRHIVGPPFLGLPPVVLARRSYSADIIYRACAANVARTIQNYTLDSEDATYSIEVIMLWA